MFVQYVWRKKHQNTKLTSSKLQKLFQKDLEAELESAAEYML